MINPEFSTNDIRGKFLLEEVKFLLYFVGAAYHVNINKETNERKNNWSLFIERKTK